MTLRLTLVLLYSSTRSCRQTIMPQLHTVACRSGNRAETLRPRSLPPGHIENIMEETNTSENIYLSVDDIPEKTFGSTGHRQARVASLLADTKLGACETTPLHKHSRFYRSMTLSPIRRLQCKARAQLLTDTGIKRAFNQTLIKPRNCRRIVALGAPRVGKTNILRRFLGEEFKEHYEATTEDFHTKLYHIRGQEYQIDILDAAGERHYPAKRRLSILTGDIFLLVFSVDNRESFREVCELIKEINAAKSKLMKLKAKVPVVVCGNKMDLGPMARVVSRFEIDSILGGEGVAYFETSAKAGTGLPCAFSALAKQGRLPNETSPTEHQNISIHTYQLLCAGSMREWRPSQLNGPIATMYPLARRPSFQSDLEQVKHLGGQNKHEKCQIQ